MMNRAVLRVPTVAWIRSYSISGMKGTPDGGPPIESGRRCLASFAGEPGAQPNQDGIVYVPRGGDEIWAKLISGKDYFTMTLIATVKDDRSETVDPLQDFGRLAAHLKGLEGHLPPGHLVEYHVLAGIMPHSLDNAITMARTLKVQAEGPLRLTEAYGSVLVGGGEMDIAPHSLSQTILMIPYAVTVEEGKKLAAALLDDLAFLSVYHGKVAFFLDAYDKIHPRLGRYLKGLDILLDDISSSVDSGSGRGSDTAKWMSALSAAELRLSGLRQALETDKNNMEKSAKNTSNLLLRWSEENIPGFPSLVKSFSESMDAVADSYSTELGALAATAERIHTVTSVLDRMPQEDDEARRRAKDSIGMYRPSRGLESFIARKELREHLSILKQASRAWWKGREGRAQSRFVLDFGVDHQEGLLRALESILMPRLEGSPGFLSEYEIFFLLASVLTHDLGMGKDAAIEPWEQMRMHGRLSSEIISRELSTGLSPEQTGILATICNYHQPDAPVTQDHLVELGAKSLSSVPLPATMTFYDSFTISNVTVDVRFLVSLLRLANTCTIDARRIYARPVSVTILESEMRAGDCLLDMLAKSRRVRTLLKLLPEGSVPPGVVAGISERLAGLSNLSGGEAGSSEEALGFVRELMVLVRGIRSIARLTDPNAQAEMADALSELNACYCRLEFVLEGSRLLRELAKVSEVVLEGDEVAFIPVAPALTSENLKKEMEPVIRMFWTDLRPIQDVLAKRGIPLQTLRLVGSEPVHIPIKTLAEKSRIMEYLVEGVFLIYRDGRTICFESRTDLNIEIFTVGAMLVAIQDYIVKGLHRPDAPMERAKFGSSEILTERGSFVFLSALITGRETEGLRARLKDTVELIEKRFRPVLEHWDGVLIDLEECRPAVKSLLSE